MKRILLISALLFFVSAGMISAQKPGKYRARQATQQARIKEGVLVKTDKKGSCHSRKKKY